MATFQDIRGHIESKVNTAFGRLNPPVEVVFDNVQETPPALPYVICLISYTNTTEPVLCQGESMVEALNGNLQLSIYAPRARGMSALELYGAEAMKVMNTMYDPSAEARVKCGQINGPVPVLSSSEPYALVTVSCPFTARYVESGGDTTRRVTTRDVLLTNPQP